MQREPISIDAGSREMDSIKRTMSEPGVGRDEYHALKNRFEFLRDTLRAMRSRKEAEEMASIDSRRS